MNLISTVNICKLYEVVNLGNNLAFIAVLVTYTRTLRYARTHTNT